MINVLLMDTLSTIHVGNGALLENTIKICKQAFGDCEFHIITMDVETNRLRYSNLYNPMFGRFWYGLGTLGKIFWAIKNFLFILLHIVNECFFKIPSEKLAFTADQKNVLRAIQRCDVAVSCGGEIIGDTFFQALPFWLFTYWLAIKKGKKFILFPQSVGPLKMVWTRLLVRLAIKDAALLVGRDKSSYETLLSLGFEQEKVMFVPDVAIQQEIGDANIHSYFNDMEKKVIGVTISKPPCREMGETVDFVSSVGGQLKQLDPDKFKILIMPSNYTKVGLSDDYKLCLQLKHELSGLFETSILENRPYFPDEYISILSQLELFISTRMHVAILATTAFIPTIAINTQHKIRGYMENIEMEEFCVDYSQIDKIFSIMQTIMANRATISCKLKYKNSELKIQHDRLVEKMCEV